MRESPLPLKETSIKKEVLNVLENNATLIFQYGIRIFLPIFLVPHFVRCIGLASFGTLAVALSWATYSAAIVQYAFNLTGPKMMIQLSEGATPALVYFDILFARVLIFSLLAPILLISSSLFPPLFKEQTIFLSFSIPFSAAINADWFLQAMGKFSLLSGCGIVGSFLTFVIGFAWVHDSGNSSIWGATMAYTLGPFAASALSAVSALRICVSMNSSLAKDLQETCGSKNQESKVFPFLLSRFCHAKHAIADGWPLFASQFVSALYTASGPILIGYLVGMEAAGTYSVLEKMVNAVSGACSLTYVAAYPRLAKLFFSSRPRFFKLLLLVVLLYLTMTSIFSLVVLCFSRKILFFLLQDSSQNNIGLLFLFLCWLCIGIFGPTLTGYLTLSGRSPIVLRLTLTIFVLSYSLGITGIYFFGGAGWMLGLILSQSVVAVYSYKYYRIEHVKE